MELTLIITCQYKENYGSSENPHWKNKMGHVFEFKTTDDLWMYASTEVRGYIDELIEGQCDDHNRYEIIDIDRQFQLPTPLGSALNMDDIPKKFYRDYETN